MSALLVVLSRIGERFRPFAFGQGFGGGKELHVRMTIE